MLRTPEPGEVSAAVRGWLTGRGYGTVTDGAPPERLTGGADFWVYGLRFAGPGLPQRWSAPLVARVPAGAGRYDVLRRESAVQCWAAARGYPAPEVLTVLAPGQAGVVDHAVDSVTAAVFEQLGVLRHFASAQGRKPRAH